MIANRSRSGGAKTAAGFTLIELMVAMVLGILVAGGIISVFLSTSKSNHVQVQMARLQENGRFAISQITQSLRMANAGYCSNSGGPASLGAAFSPGSVYVDSLRSPTVVAANISLPDNTTPFGATSATNTYPDLPTAASDGAGYALPSFLYMRGYECDATSCTPVDPATATSVPSAGTAVGNRVVGTDVLTLRYLESGAGWSIGSDDTVSTTAFLVDKITVNAETGEMDPDEAAGHSLFLYGDCSQTTLFASTPAAASSSGLTVTVGPLGTGAGKNLEGFGASRDAGTQTKLFDFQNAFNTVTWYLEVVADGSASGQVTGALMRRVNGASGQEVVRGVERLDFRYGVLDNDGETRYLTADQVDSRAGGTINCPPQPPDTLAGGTNPPGCLWRAVQTIQISMLVDGQQALPSLGDTALAYSYSVDALTPAPPDDASHTVKYSDQGFERGLLRREFNTAVSVRNFNP